MVPFSSILNVILKEETFKGKMKINISYIVKPLIEFHWIADGFYSNMCWLGNSVSKLQLLIIELKNDFQLQWRLVKAQWKPFCKWNAWSISLFLTCLRSEKRHKSRREYSCWDECMFYVLFILSESRPFDYDFSGWNYTDKCLNYQIVFYMYKFNFSWSFSVRIIAKFASEDMLIVFF